MNREKSIICFWQNEKKYKENIPELCKSCHIFLPTEGWCKDLTYEEGAFYCSNQREDQWIIKGRLG
jgi:hypothetical protein